MYMCMCDVAAAVVVMVTLWCVLCFVYGVLCV